MKLILKRPIVFFDIETTGLNISTDKIVEISLLKIFPSGEKEGLTFLINPEMSIPEEATLVHGISNGDVENSPTFKQKADEIYNFITGCDLAGYNIDKFDTPILIRQLQSEGYFNPIPDVLFIDVYKIFINKEPRKLADAYKLYCNKVLEDAHSAESDIKATFEVLEGMLEKYEDLKSNIISLSEFSSFDTKKLVDLSGKLIKNDTDEIVFNFGSHKGQRVVDNLDYVDWMLKTDFPDDTKKILAKIRAAN